MGSQWSQGSQGSQGGRGLNSREFRERFRGKIALMDKSGHIGIIARSGLPIDKDYSRPSSKSHATGPNVALPPSAGRQNGLNLSQDHVQCTPMSIRQSTAALALHLARSSVRDSSCSTVDRQALYMRRQLVKHDYDLPEKVVAISAKHIPRNNLIPMHVYSGIQVRSKDRIQHRSDLSPLPLPNISQQQIAGRAAAQAAKHRKGITHANHYGSILKSLLKAKDVYDSLAGSLLELETGPAELLNSPHVSAQPHIRYKNLISHQHPPLRYRRNTRQIPLSHNYRKHLVGSSCPRQFPGRPPL
jgi:hypothetical protein